MYPWTGEISAVVETMWILMCKEASALGMDAAIELVCGANESRMQNPLA